MAVFIFLLFTFTSASKNPSLTFLNSLLISLRAAGALLLNIHVGYCKDLPSASFGGRGGVAQLLVLEREAGAPNLAALFPGDFVAGDRYAQPADFDHRRQLWEGDCPGEEQL